MDTSERAIMRPRGEIAVHRAARRQILWQSAPLTARAQHIHHGVDHLAHHHRALVLTALRRGDKRLNQPPFGVGQVTGVAHLAAVIAMAVLVGPHGAAPANRAATSESQLTLRIQGIMAQTLRKS